MEAPGRLRWASPGGPEGASLIAGDRGTLLLYRDGSGTRLETGTRVNLRCAAFSAPRRTTYACGNDGLVLRVSEGRAERVGVDARDNLRRLSWDPSGQRCLVVGNNGTALTLGPTAFETVHGADTNLRSVVWHPSGGYALVAGNCFRDSVGGLSPSPNLFRFEGGRLVDVSTMAESRADLVAASWRPDGSSCLLAGYDQTWHTPSLVSFEDGSLRVIPWVAENVFPTACSWHPSGEYALIGTSQMTDEEGSTAIYRYDGRAVAKVADLRGFGVSCISWHSDHLALVIASRSVRAYSA